MAEGTATDGELVDGSLSYGRRHVASRRGEMGGFQLIVAASRDGWRTRAPLARRALVSPLIVTDMSVTLH